MSTSSDPFPADVLDALRQGSKIEAIKRLREHAGIGLKEAKDLIDAYQRGPGAVLSAAKTGDPAPSRGGIGWALVLVAIAALAWLMLRPN